MTTLQEVLLSWLRNSEERRTRRDLFAAFPSYSPVILERALAKLVRDGWATWDGTHWTTRTTVVLDADSGPGLLALLRGLERERHIPGYGNCCPVCDQQPDNGGHAAGCELHLWVERLALVWP